ncbi:MAG: hypothetical protein WBK55_10085 [Alphaproteobacteria bacterium]
MTKFTYEERDRIENEFRKIDNHFRAYIRDRIKNSDHSLTRQSVWFNIASSEYDHTETCLALFSEGKPYPNEKIIILKPRFNGTELLFDYEVKQYGEGRGPSNDGVHTHGAKDVPVIASGTMNTYNAPDSVLERYKHNEREYGKVLEAEKTRKKRIALGAGGAILVAFFLLSKGCPAQGGELEDKRSNDNNKPQKIELTLDR